MEKEEILSRMESLDPEVFTLLQQEIRAQRYTLSLLPTANAVSPYASYIYGSLFTGSSFGYYTTDAAASLETLAKKRARELFGAESAVVRFGNIAVASRVVFLATLEEGATVLTFNHRKEEHCEGLTYRFIDYGIAPDTETVDWDDFEKKARAEHPALIICSPVHYPRHIDAERLARIAHEVGALLWVDLGQNVGLVAAGILPNPTQTADIVTFPTNDALHGPDGAVVLASKEITAKVKEVIIKTAHAALHTSQLAALAVALKEATFPIFRTYGDTALKNAQALAAALLEKGIPLMTGGTDTHLVLVKLPDTLTDETLRSHLKKVGLHAHTGTMETRGGGEPGRVLFLSTLNPTTRGLKEKDMGTLSEILAAVLDDELSEKELEKLHSRLMNLLLDKPIFSEEWARLDSAPVLATDVGESHEAAQTIKRSLLMRLFTRN